MFAKIELHWPYTYFMPWLLMVIRRMWRSGDDYNVMKSIIIIMMIVVEMMIMMVMMMI